MLAGPLPESVSRSLVQHQVVERVARETLDDRQTARIVETILSSPEFEAALHRVASSPALREALTQQTADFGDQIMTDLQGPHLPGGRSARAQAARLDASRRAHGGRPVRRASSAVASRSRSTCSS